MRSCLALRGHSSGGETVHGIQVVNGGAGDLCCGSQLMVKAARAGVLEQESGWNWPWELWAEHEGGGGYLEGRNQGAKACQAE
jgi:hypothetical protein